MRFMVLLDIPTRGIQGFVDGWRNRKPKDVKILLRLHVSAEKISGAQLHTVIEAEKMSVITDYCKSLEEQGARVQLIPVYDDKSTSRELKSYQNAKLRAERHNRVKVRKLKGVGAIENLEVLPLIDWRTSGEGLIAETGVSYLVRTDCNTILFDAGLNAKEEYPSPLLRNMQKLGVTLNEIDTIFISHNHGDHVGGEKWEDDKTFSLTGRQEPLGSIKVYVPTRMTYPGLEPMYARFPTVIGKGVASTGTIASSIYFGGFTEEHSLVVNVEGKGLVLIVGCGHHTVPRILERVGAIFEEPIYGIIGGLHYPVMGGPKIVYGYAEHKYVGTGKPPWEHITVEELNTNIELLKHLKLGLVAPSPHDSSDLSLTAFKNAFPDCYRNLRVGDPIFVK